MFIESLENRTLFTVSPVSSAVATDLTLVHSDLLKFKADCLANTATILADVQALKADDVQKDAVLAPLFQTLHGDLESMWAALKADRLTEKSNVLRDESTIVTDLEQFNADKGNAADLKTDRANLIAAHIQLQNDEIAGLNARLATRQADCTTLFNDMTAITNAIGSDANATAQVKADVGKFVTDRTNCLDTIEGDLQKLIADRSNLVTAMTAMQSQT